MRSRILNSERDRR